MTRRPLTEAQRKVYDFILEWMMSDHHPPTWKQIADGLGFRSPSGAVHHVDALVKKGWLRRSEDPSVKFELDGFEPCPRCRGLGMIPAKKHIKDRRSD